MFNSVSVNRVTNGKRILDTVNTRLITGESGIILNSKPVYRYERYAAGNPTGLGDGGLPI